MTVSEKKEMYTAADLVIRGDALMDNGNYDDAIAIYNAALEANSNNHEVRLNRRAKAYLYKGDYERAAADYIASMAINPNYSGVSSFIYHLSQKSHNYYDMIIEISSIFIETIPEIVANSKTNLLVLRSGAYAKKGDYDNAIADCRTVLESGETFFCHGHDNIICANTMFQILLCALFYTHNDKYYATISNYHNMSKTIYNFTAIDNAIALLDTIIKDDPHDCTALRSRGEIYYYKGLTFHIIIDRYSIPIVDDENYYLNYYQKEVADLTEALKNDPDNQEIKSDLKYAQDEVESWRSFVVQNKDWHISWYESAVKNIILTQEIRCTMYARKMSYYEEAIANFTTILHIDTDNEAVKKRLKTAKDEFEELKAEYEEEKVHKRKAEKLKAEFEEEMALKEETEKRKTEVEKDV